MSEAEAVAVPTNDLEKILATSPLWSSLSKKDAEFVITRYDEPLDWIHDIKHLATIYNKGAECFKEAINVPNYGYGLETILRHIITRYDTLAERTMFCQGRIADRIDQPLYPLTWYFEGADVKGYLTDAYDSPKSRYRHRLTDPATFAIDNLNLKEFREKIGFPYRYLNEMWIRGDWISVTATVIRKKPLAFWQFLYDVCKFNRGVIVEECWFLERSLYSIFTSNQMRGFDIPPFNPSPLCL